MQDKYWEYEYEEVVTPNIFNVDLWRTSGHADHYKENMFFIDIEKAEFGLKPMNCPAHCLMFGARKRSYRELPMRLADFGVLHRNEFSGAPTASPASAASSRTTHTPSACRSTCASLRAACCVLCKYASRHWTSTP